MPLSLALQGSFNELQNQIDQVIGKVAKIRPTINTILANLGID